MIDVLRFRPAATGLVIERYHAGVNRNFVANLIPLRVELSGAALNQNSERARGAKVHLGLGREDFRAEVFNERIFVDRLPAIEN